MVARFEIVRNPYDILSRGQNGRSLLASRPGGYRFHGLLPNLRAQCARPSGSSRPHRRTHDGSLLQSAALPAHRGGPVDHTADFVEAGKGVQGAPAGDPSTVREVGAHPFRPSEGDQVAQVLTVSGCHVVAVNSEAIPRPSVPIFVLLDGRRCVVREAIHRKPRVLSMSDNSELSDAPWRGSTIRCSTIELRPPFPLARRQKYGGRAVSESRGE